MKVGSISAFNEYAEEYDKWYWQEMESLVSESEARAVETLGSEGLRVELGALAGENFFIE